MQPETIEYAEISLYLRGRFRPLNSPEDQAYAHFNTFSAGASREEFAVASPLPDAVNRFLLQMDAKLDALLATLHSSSLSQDFPHTMEILSLSAARLQFSTDMPLAKGDWLEVLIKFRETEITTAAGIGTVLERNINKDGIPVFTFAFTRIEEEEREKIIRHVFMEERRMLRAARLE